MSLMSVNANTKVDAKRAPVMDAELWGSPPPAKRWGGVRGGGPHFSPPPPTRLGPAVLATLPAASRGEGEARPAIEALGDRH
jgi:hypothetical protein